MRPRYCLILVVLLLSVLPLHASPIVIDFEGLADGTALTDQYLAANGVTFANAFILTSGVSLNDADFPPRSGTNVAANVDPNSGNSYSTITVNFASPVLDFGAYFTYALSQGLSIQGFDSSNNVILSAVVTSAFLQNDNFCTPGPGCSPTPLEFLEISSSLGIASVTITGDAVGDPFTLDDVTVDPLPTLIAAVPEPSTFSMLLIAGAAVVGVGTVKKRSNAVQKM